MRVFPFWKSYTKTNTVYSFLLLGIHTHNLLLREQRARVFSKTFIKRSVYCNDPAQRLSVLVDSLIGFLRTDGLINEIFFFLLVKSRFYVVDAPLLIFPAQEG